MGLSELLTPRHIIITAVATMLSGTGGFGLLTVAASEGPEIEGVLTIPLPNVGDSGLFVYEHRGVDGQSLVAPMHAVQFTWDATEVHRDGLGTQRQVNPLRIAVDSSAGFNGQGGWHTEMLLVPGGEMHSMARIDADVETQTGPPSLIESTSSTRDVAYTWFYETKLNCFVRNPLQATQIDLASGFAEPTGCQGFVPTHDFKAKATDGNGTVLFEALRGRGVMVEMVLQDGHPYPLKYSIIDEAKGTQTWTLKALNRGTEPIAGNSVVVNQQPVKGVKENPTTLPILTYDADLASRHPYRLSEAYADATLNPEVADWMDAHPRHYVGYASYVLYSSDDGDEHRWLMRLADGKEMLDVSVSETYDLPVGPTDLAWDIYYAAEIVEWQDYFPDYYQPDASLLPDTFPTASSLIGYWEAFTDNPDSGGVGWSYFVGCLKGKPCDAPQVSISVGRWNSFNGQSGISRISGWDIDTLYIENGAAQGHRDDRTDWKSEYLAPIEPEETQLAPTSLQTVDTTGLTNLEIGAAAAGFGVLIGALVWVWPVAKHLGVAMFTRVRNDKLLEHPVRSQLMTAIAATPGVHHQELVRVGGVGKGATEQHLRKLTAAGLVTAAKGTGYTCYFPKGAVDNRVMQAAPLMKSKVARAIVAYVNGRPGARAAEIRTALKITPSTLHYHMKRLEEAGVIDVRKAGNGNVLDLTHTGRMVAAS